MLVSRIVYFNFIQMRKYMFNRSFGNKALDSKVLQNCNFFLLFYNNIVLVVFVLKVAISSMYIFI